jgi:hypothetical protein
MIDYNEMMKRIKELPEDQRIALEGFFKLDSDHQLVRFADQLQNVLRKAMKK